MIISKIKKTDIPALVGSNRQQTSSPTFSIIIPCHNEETHIEEKILNTISLNYPTSPDIYIISDNSTDNTLPIAKKFKSEKIHIFESNIRLGKEGAINSILHLINSDYCLFTDTKVALEKEALIKFSRIFLNQKIGAISSKDVVRNSNQNLEKQYVSMEMLFRKLENLIGGPISLSGSCFAVRTSLLETIPNSCAGDLFYGLKIKLKGFNTYHASDIEHVYSSVNSPKEELERKIRTIQTGINTVVSIATFESLKNSPLTAIQILFRKLIKWAIPIFYFSTLLILLQTLPKVGILIILVQILCLLLWKYNKQSKDLNLIKTIIYFNIYQVAIIIAWIRYLKNENCIFWTPSIKI